MFLVHGQFQFCFFDLWYEITWNMLVLNIRSMTTRNVKFLERIESLKTPIALVSS
jgi:hypothetical protein